MGLSYIYLISRTYKIAKHFNREMKRKPGNVQGNPHYRFAVYKELLLQSLFIKIKKYSRNHDDVSPST